jgi:putative restriction endonuclease
MENLEELLVRLPDRHRDALRWFAEHAGTDMAWPVPLPGGTFLATKAKGIYKPNWTKYALSIRQTLNSPYHDTAPSPRPDGTWSYSYYQEKDNPADRDSVYTNRALLACCEDTVPIGVMRQVSSRPQNRYHIDGLALVTNWEEGYFHLEGFSPADRSNTQVQREETFHEEPDMSSAYIESFNPKDILDERMRAASFVVRRPGQSEFRIKLLEIYHGRCCISGYDAVEVLEAAHIIPYLGPKTNHPSNGLLLRADLHILFDLGLIAVDTETMRVIVSSKLGSTAYAAISGIRLYIPEDVNVRPSILALNQHRNWADFKVGSSTSILFKG